MQKPPGAAQNGQLPRPNTPKSGQQAIPAQPARPANGFAAKQPAAEPARQRKPPSEPPDFEIEIDDNGEGEVVRAPVPKSNEAMLELISRLSPVLAKLERAIRSKAMIITVDPKLIQLKGDRLFMGATAIGETRDRKVSIWLDALGYPIAKLPPEVFTTIDSCFKTAGPLFAHGLANSSRVSLVSDYAGISLCLHKTEDGPAFIRFPARPPETQADKK